MAEDMKYTTSIRDSEARFQVCEHEDLTALAVFLRTNGLKPLYTRTSRARQPETPWCLVECEDGSRVPIAQQSVIAAWLRPEAVA